MWTICIISVRWIQRNYHINGYKVVRRTWKMPPHYLGKCCRLQTLGLYNVCIEHSVATLLPVRWKCLPHLHREFSYESIGERILQIGPYLLCYYQNISSGFVFLRLSVVLHDWRKLTRSEGTYTTVACCDADNVITGVNSDTLVMWRRRRRFAFTLTTCYLLK